MATRSSILAWRILGTKEPGGLQHIGSQTVRHGWETNTFTYIQIYMYVWVYIYIYIYIHFAFHKNNKSVVLVWRFLSTACHTVPITISPFYWNWTGLCFQNRARDPAAANRHSTGVQKVIKITAKVRWLQTHFTAIQAWTTLWNLCFLALST